MGNSLIKNTEIGASLVAQWLRVCMPMQGTRVRALVWEDPTCRGATKPVHHNYWACASGACAPQREAATVRGPRTAMKSGPCLPQLEKALAQKWRPNTAKKKKKKKTEISGREFPQVLTTPPPAPLPLSPCCPLVGTRNPLFFPKTTSPREPSTHLPSQPTYLALLSFISTACISSQHYMTCYYAYCLLSASPT